MGLLWVKAREKEETFKHREIQKLGRWRRGSGCTEAHKCYLGSANSLRWRAEDTLPLQQGKGRRHRVQCGHVASLLRIKIWVAGIDKLFAEMAAQQTT